MGPNPTLVEIMKTEEVPNLNWQAIVVEKGRLDHMKEEVMTMKMKSEVPFSSSHHPHSIKTADCYCLPFSKWKLVNRKSKTGVTLHNKGKLIKTNLFQNNI